jgi:hypothetical protein
MTEEQLKAAHLLRSKIDSLKSHADDIQRYATEGGRDPEEKGVNMHLGNNNWGNSSHVYLRPQFLILPVKELKKLYLQKLNEEIADLEKQFSEI